MVIAAFVSSLIVGPSTTAGAATTVLINDGEAHVLPLPGVPSLAATDFVVRDAGCGTPGDPWIEPCLTGGAPTRVTFGSFANYGGNLIVRDRSSIVVDGVDLSGDPVPAFIGGVSAGGSSHVDIQSGRMNGLLLFASATATITGGEGAEGRPLFVDLANASQVDIDASVGHIALRGSSSATLRGSGTQAFVATGGELRIEGGSLVELIGQLGTITMKSGSIQSLSLDGLAQMTVLGGVPQTSGLQPITLKASSRLTLTGVAFRLDGLPVGPGVVAETSGHLEVTDATGLTYATDFAREPTALLVLIPEPSTATLMAMGLAAIGVKRRRPRRSLSPIFR